MKSQDCPSSLTLPIHIQVNGQHSPIEKIVKKLSLSIKKNTDIITNRSAQIKGGK